MVRTKKELRLYIQDKRNSLDHDYRDQWSWKVSHRIWELIDRLQPKVIHSFIPIKSEIDLSPFLSRALESELTMVTSKTLTNSKLEHIILNDLTFLEHGIYNTLYPGNGQIYSGHYDLILVPGLAFDMKGNRLGYGAGYYDIFLSQNPSSFKVGVGYPFQLVDSVPIEKHDIPLDLVICD